MEAYRAAEARLSKGRLAACITLTLLSYVVTTTIIFSDPLDFLFLWDEWREWLGLTNLFWAIVAGFILICLILGRFARHLPGDYKGAWIFIPALLLPVVFFSAMTILASHMEARRADEIARFSPDELCTNSFWESLHAAPQEFGLFLHAAALKDCKPYAWSYRDMAFYPLVPNVAVNVVPQTWIEKCGIKRVY